MNTVAHIINPFKAGKSSDLFIAQPLTFQSILLAKEKANSFINVELLSAQFEEDKDFIPSQFRQTINLNQSVLDKHKFNKHIKFPLLIDILERLYNESKAEYLIYTNVDIGLYPDFYLKVNDFINEGYDAFIINRRRLSSKYKEPSQLNELFKDSGKSHPGFDCFVFHRSLFPKLKLQGICIGVPFIEISFSQNLFALSKKFHLFDKEFITFHIGMEIYKKRAPKEYFNYNKNQFWKLVPQLQSEMELKRFPYSNYLWPARLLKWTLHPCIPIRLVFRVGLFNLKKRIGLK